MQNVTRQLELVRRVGRRLLLAQVVLRWLAVVVLVMVLAGLVDYALDLPAWLRMALAVVGVVVGGLWLARRLTDAARFRPELSVLALRAERLFPQVAGLLASSVEFTAGKSDATSDPRTIALAQAVVDQTQQQLGSARIRRLVDPVPTLQRLGLAALALVVLSAIVFTAPTLSAIGASRWLTPWNDAAWPRRTTVASLTHHQVWPSDTPLRLRARVEAGYRQGMRTTLRYRVVSAGGDNTWRTVLMNDQTGTTEGDVARGDFESLLDPAEALAAAGLSPATSGIVDLEFAFEAGDHRGQPQRVRLVERPAARDIRVTVEPPAYARGLLSPQHIALDEQGGGVTSVSALEGATVTLSFRSNKPIVAPHINPRDIFEGLDETQAQGVVLERDEAGALIGAQARFRLTEHVETPIRLTDEHNLASVSERSYRVEVVRDQLPAASIVEPRADESVLPTARFDVSAMGQDDLAVESLALEAQLPQDAARAADSGAEGGDVQAKAWTPLERVTGRSSRLDLRYDLDLSRFTLRPGDEVVLTAVAQDVFELDDRRHEPVRSAVRRLRVIDAHTLVAELRNDLEAVRQQAIRLESQQRAQLEATAARAAAAQQEIGRRIESQSAVLRALAERLQRNRMDAAQAGPIAELLPKAGEIVREASEASREADRKLDAARQDEGREEDAAAEASRDAARDLQAAVAQSMASLVALLDQGRDTAAVRMQLAQLQAMQESAAAQTRELMPRTLGQSPEELSPEDRAALSAMAERQAALSAQAEALARQMQTTAEALSRGQSPEEQAASQALSEAAAIAQRQGLTQQMQRASEASAENRLSEAGGAQQTSLETMRQMMSELDSQQSRQQAVLRRRLLQLREAIERLIVQHKSQLQRIEVAQQFGGLDAAMSMVRRNTMAVEEDARAADETVSVAKFLEQAVSHQGETVTALIAADGATATASGREGLKSLEAALEEIERLQQQAEARERQRERARLQAEYEKLEAEQNSIAAATEKLTTDQPLDRRQRVELIDLGHREADLKADAAELKKEVETAMVFVFLHERIDKLAESVATRLRNAQSNAAVLGDQKTIESMLRTMAAALEQAQRDDPFASGDGGGGGGGGGGEPQNLVPPVAELRLLRGMQDQLLQRTRTAAALPGDAAANDNVRREVLMLSAEQRELSSLSNRFVEQMRQQQQPGAE